MSTDSLKEIVKTLSDLKVTDLAKLKKMLEEEWGVTAAAPVAVAAVAAAASSEEGSKAKDEPTEFQVTITDVPEDKRIGAIKVVREITGLGLKEAKDIVTSTPKVIKDSAPKAEAESIIKKLEAAGAKATMKGV